MCMGGEKGKKKDVHPKRTNFFKIMLKYETDQLKPKSAASCKINRRQCKTKRSPMQNQQLFLQCQLSSYPFVSRRSYLC